MTDVFALQEDLARDIAGAMGSAVRGGSSPGASLSVAKSRGTSNEQAYELYVRARYLLNHRSQLSQAIAIFDSATRLDPSYAQALAGAATAASVQPFYGGASSPDALRRTREYASRAIAIDSTLSEPHAALGHALAKTYAYDDAEREFKHAIALDSSSAIALHLYGFMLLGVGRPAEALPLYEKAGRLDPLSRPVAEAHTYSLVLNGRPDAAIAVGEHFAMVDSATSEGLVSYVYASQRKWSEAWKALEPHAVRASNARRDIVRILVELGRRHEADSVRALLQDSAEHGGRYADVAVAYAALGDTAHTLEWLRRAIDRYDGGLLDAQIPTRQEFDFLRRDPRFKTLMARMGVK